MARKYLVTGLTQIDTVVLHDGTVLIAGVCTEACCFSTARDAGFRGMKIGFLADLTGTIDYPDLGYGSMTAQEMHRATALQHRPDHRPRHGERKGPGADGAGRPTFR